LIANLLTATDRIGITGALSANQELKQMQENTFELDLLDFHGEPLDLFFAASGADASWVLEGAPNPLRLEPGEEFRVELRAQRIDTTIYLAGTIRGLFAYQCGRCMQWRRFELDESVDFVLMSRASWADRYESEDEIALDEADLDVSSYEGDLIDLRTLLREAVLLEMPGYPRCTDELRDLCDRDFERIVGQEKLAENEANSLDLRWAKLRDIKLGDRD
jgi:uncharacterized protein